MTAMLCAAVTLLAACKDDAWKGIVGQAAAEGDLVGMIAALPPGGSFDYRTAEAPPPLIAAVDANQNEIVLYILNHGGSVNFPDGLGATALGWSIFWGNRDIVKTLLENGAEFGTGDKALLSNLDEGRRQSVKDILADFNLQL